MPDRARVAVQVYNLADLLKLHALMKRLQPERFVGVAISEGCMAVEIEWTMAIEAVLRKSGLDHCGVD